MRRVGRVQRRSWIRLARHARTAVEKRKLEPEGERQDRSNWMQSDRVPRKARHEDIRLELLDDEEGGRHPENRGERHRRGDEQRGDRAGDGSDHRDELGQGGEHREKERVRNPENEQSDADEHADGEREQELGANVRAEDARDLLEDAPHRRTALWLERAEQRDAQTPLVEQEIEGDDEHEH